MPDAAPIPFTAFNFAVEISVPALGTRLCNAAFAECDGLEMTMDVKSIREGGNNTSQVRLFGAVNYVVIDDPARLPLRIPEIYRALTT